MSDGKPLHRIGQALPQPKNTLPQSGVPGLVYRRRGNGGSWIVVVFVAKHLRPLITNGNGKPLARLERSTGTSDLKLAKACYAEIRSALEQEIQVRSGSLSAPAADATQATELRQFQLKRRLGEEFAAVSQHPPQLKTNSTPSSRQRRRTTPRCPKHRWLPSSLQSASSPAGLQPKPELLADTYQGDPYWDLPFLDVWQAV